MASLLQFPMTLDELADPKTQFACYPSLLQTPPPSPRARFAEIARDYAQQASDTVPVLSPRWSGSSDLEKRERLATELDEYMRAGPTGLY